MNHLIRAHAALLFAGVATFVMMGAGQSLYGPALPAFSRIFDVTVAEAGVLVSAHWVGCFIGVGLMYLRGAGITPRHALAVMAVGGAVVAALAGWWVTVAGAVVFGAGYGMSAAVFNPRVLRAFGSQGPAMLSLLNATFGVGAIAAPLIFVALDSDPRWSFGLTALLAAAIWVFAGAAALLAGATPGALAALASSASGVGFGEATLADSLTGSGAFAADSEFFAPSWASVSFAGGGANSAADGLAAISASCARRLSAANALARSSSAASAAASRARRSFFWAAAAACCTLAR